MTAATSAHSEAVIALPSRLLFGSVMGVTALLAAGWLVISVVAGTVGAVTTAGVVGIALVAGISLLSVLIMAPWKSRPILTWMSIWMGGTVARLLVTPAVTFLLYSAVSLNATALTVSVAAAYLAVLLTEA